MSDLSDDATANPPSYKSFVQSLISAYFPPKTAFVYAEAVRVADQKFVEAQSALSRVERVERELLLLHWGSSKQRLASERQYILRRRAHECTTERLEANRALSLFLVSLDVMRDVVAALCATNTAEEALKVLPMERDLLEEFPPFIPVLQALRAIEIARKMTDGVHEAQKANVALRQELDTALVWLSDPANVDPEWRPSPQASAASAPGTGLEVDLEEVRAKTVPPDDED